VLLNGTEAMEVTGLVIVMEQGVVHDLPSVPSYIAGGRQHRVYIIPQAVTHSLVLLKMGKIIARNI